MHYIDLMSNDFYKHLYYFKENKMQDVFYNLNLNCLNLKFLNEILNYSFLILSSNSCFNNFI